MIIFTVILKIALKNKHLKIYIFTATLTSKHMKVSILIWNTCNISQLFSKEKCFTNSFFYTLKCLLPNTWKYMFTPTLRSKHRDLRVSTLNFEVYVVFLDHSPKRNATPTFSFTLSNAYSLMTWVFYNNIF
jgi:hypothetical protein